MSEKGLSMLTNAAKAISGQMTLVNGIVDRKMEVADARPRVGNGALH